MTRQNARTHILDACNEAHSSGLSWVKIASESGFSTSTLQRWRSPGNADDQRPLCDRPTPVNALSQEEKQRIRDTCNQPEYASSPPAQIVADLADKGVYIASESTFYRVLREAGQQHHRGRARAPARRRQPARHTATAPNQVWVWDITWIPSHVTGRFFKLYSIMDLFSRKIVAAELFESENAEHSIDIFQRACIAEGILPGLVLHGDNGAPLKAYTLLAKMEALGVKPSHSRPRVSNDNAHAEAFFRTLKYSPAYRPEGFETLTDARQWTEDFINWYNLEHRHSGIGMVTPAQKHNGEDIDILAKRRALYEKAKAKNPSRWIKGKPRSWRHVSSVDLNPINIRNLERNLKKSA